MSRFDLGWGNSVAVREAFLNTYHQNPMVLAKEELLKYDYTAHEGDPELVEITKQIVKRQTGQDYKYLYLVNGATGGVIIALRAMKQRGAEFCRTRPAPFYVKYPLIIKTAGLEHVSEDDRNRDGVNLVDYPSNPLGLTTSFGAQDIPTIIDGVYLNNIYMPLTLPVPHHDIMIGSYSKLTGLNGVRVGWIATNDPGLSYMIQDLVTAEYCGLDKASTDILKHTIQGFDWARFETSARFKLDCNREEWQKMERFFGGTPVTQVGMFQYAPVDSKCEKLLIKAGIHWTKGSDLGTDDGFGRFNLGAKNEVVNDAIKAFLKADKI